MWTCFWDMHSGGRTKIVLDGIEKDMIYIESPTEEQAIHIFEDTFGRDPHNVTCNCCGEDYSLQSDESLQQLTAYHRNCDYGYFDPEGKQCSQSEAWVSGEGMKEGYTARYVERKNPVYKETKYRPLDFYLMESDVMVIYAPKETENV